MSLLDGVSSLVIAGYLGLVVMNGNMSALIQQLKTEIGYVEILIAYFFVRELMNYPATSDLSKAFMGVAMVAFAIRVISIIPPEYFSQFAGGQISISDFLLKIAGSLNSAVSSHLTFGGPTEQTTGVK